MSTTDRAAWQSRLEALFAGCLHLLVQRNLARSRAGGGPYENLAYEGRANGLTALGQCLHYVGSKLGRATFHVEAAERTFDLHNENDVERYKAAQEELKDALNYVLMALDMCDQRSKEGHK